MPNVISGTLLRNLFTGFKTSFQNGFAGVTPAWSQIATKVASMGAEEDYGWLGDWPAIREWIGDRVLEELAGYSYTVKNRDFESTVRVKRNHIEDDKLGIYRPMFEGLGQEVALFPDKLIFALLAAGATTKCYDGQYFFDTDHPVAGGVASNHGGGAGTPWFLLDTTRPLKPLIYQERQAFGFAALDRDTDENVFMRKEYIYGTDGRANAGFGFWQMAFMSRQTLDAAGYEAARAAMRSLKRDNGEPLGVRPNLLVVPGSLEGAGRRLLKNDLAAGGASNEWAGTADLLVADFL